MTAPDPRRSMADYADLADTYGIPEEEIRRWMAGSARFVPVTPGALYVRPANPVLSRAPGRRRSRFALYGLMVSVVAAIALMIAGYVVYRYPLDAPVPCSPGTCQVVTPTTIGPPPR